MLYVWFPLSLRNVEDLLHERGIEVSRETPAFGGTDLALSSLPKSEKDEFTSFVHTLQFSEK